MIVYFEEIFGVYDCRPFKFKGAFIKIFGASAEDEGGRRDKMWVEGEPALPAFN